jgi:cellulose synthase operon protein C
LNDTFASMLRRSLALIIVVVVLAGCGETSFLGRHVDNFTAFYNTFYNARKSFDRGIENLQGAQAAIDRDRFLAVYPPPGPVGNRQDFDDAIRRSADILREHPNSRWIDDAVMLIGKSYFYQQNYNAAAQKFRETIELDTRLQDEARFWLARTLIANGEYDAAQDHLAETLTREQIDRRVLPQMHLSQADLAVRLRDWAGAIDALQSGLRDIRDRQDEARGWFLLGQVYDEVGEVAQAQAAFERVTRLSAPFELDYAARLLATTLHAEMGDRAAATEGLRRMERDGKYSDRRAEIAYMRGRALVKLGEPDEAFYVFDDVLYSQNYDVSRVRARVHRALADLYRYDYGDYTLAAAHYDTSASSIPAPRQGQVMPPGVPTRSAILDSREIADVFRTFARVHEEVARMDSLLRLADMPQEEFDAFILEQRHLLAREMAERRREQERLRAEQQFVNPGAQQQELGGDAAGGTGGGASGFLFHRDPIRVQEGRQAFVRRWGERPLVPGWRRADAVVAHREEQRHDDDGGIHAIPESVVAGGDMDLPFIDFSDVPREPFLRQQMEAELARSSYELGNVLFLSMREPDRAAEWYRRVIDYHDEQNVRGRAYYALAELMRDAGDHEQARTLYEEVLEQATDEELITRVREHLGMEVAVRTDSASVARDRYEASYRQWQRGQLEPAFAEMIEIAMQYRDTEAAPRSLMASAKIGLEWIRRDTLDLFEPLPVFFSDSLLVAGGLIDGRTQQPFLALGVVAEEVEQGQTSLSVLRVLSHLANVYSTHRLAPQARDIIAGLNERRPIEEPVARADAEPVTDAAVDQDATPTDDLVTETVVLGDPHATPAPASSAAIPNSMYGGGGIDVAMGGFSFATEGFGSRGQAAAMLEQLIADGFLADMHEDSSSDAPYRILIGHFSTEEIAAAVYGEQGRRLPVEVEIIALQHFADSP